MLSCIVRATVRIEGGVSTDITTRFMVYPHHGNDVINVFAYEAIRCLLRKCVIIDRISWALKDEEET